MSAEASGGVTESDVFITIQTKTSRSKSIWEVTEEETAELSKRFRDFANDLSAAGRVSQRLEEPTSKSVLKNRGGSSR